MRRPVKEPGPSETATESRPSGLISEILNSHSVASNIFSECECLRFIEVEKYLSSEK